MLPRGLRSPGSAQLHSRSSCLEAGFRTPASCRRRPLYQLRVKGSTADADLAEACPATASTSGSSQPSQAPAVFWAEARSRAGVLLQRPSQGNESPSQLASSALWCALAVAVPPCMPGNGLPDLLTNRVFMVGLLSWFLAQIGKIFTHLFKKREWRWDACLQPGGMPSSHSSLCVGVTTAIAWQQGLGSPLFAAALCFSLCVMYDAMGIRRHAGKQAEALNKVISELRKDDPQSAIKAEVLKEVLGHTPRQVAAGAVLGVLVGLAMPGGPWCC